MIMIRKTALPLLVAAVLSMAFTTTYKPKYPVATGFAVVELFTSEGCSSCPPADVLLAKIENESKNKPVYLLAYHVDYWDRLGWKDSFSSAKFSARQNQYADWLNLKTVYTPQVVVNGSSEFVGSESATLHSSIATALAKPTNNTLEISLNKADQNKLSVNYKTNQKTDSYAIVLALVDANATSKVLKGENKGRTLSHVQIVDQFESIALKGKMSGQVDIQFEKTSRQTPSELIAFLQDNNSGKITAATRLNLQ